MFDKKGVIAIIIGVILLGGFIFVQANDEMIVEANFVGFDSESIQINVPDYIFLGNVSVEDPFYETKLGEVFIENTGRVDSVITPMLDSEAEEVFNFISFRRAKTSSNETLNEFHGINDNWTIEVERGQTEGFYMSIDLTDFTGTLSSEEIKLNSTIKFNAMAG